MIREEMRKESVTKDVEREARSDWLPTSGARPIGFFCRQRCFEGSALCRNGNTFYFFALRSQVRENERTAPRWWGTALPTSDVKKFWRTKMRPGGLSSHSLQACLPLSPFLTHTHTHFLSFSLHTLGYPSSFFLVAATSRALLRAVPSRVLPDFCKTLREDEQETKLFFRKIGFSRKFSSLWRFFFSNSVSVLKRKFLNLWKLCLWLELKVDPVVVLCLRHLVHVEFYST